ncbi:MAG: hypothetical protein H0W38_17275 [Methylibium sp.]|nr:hypothetical protein [Methylibium sp.]
MGIVHLDAEILHRRLEFGMAEQQLHGPQALCAPIDQRRLGSPHRVRAVVCRELAVHHTVEALLRGRSPV